MTELKGLLTESVTDEKDVKRMLDSAQKGVENAYTPVSDFSVGASVLTNQGNIYKGANTQAVILDLSSCAERNAVNNAVSNGEYNFEALLVTSEKEKVLRPCGACLQYLNEFSQVSGEDIEIIMYGSPEVYEVSSIGKMFPDTVGPDNLDVDLSDYRD